MEVSIYAGRVGEKNANEVTKKEFEDEKDLHKFLAGRDLLLLLRKEMGREDLAVCRTIFDPEKNILFVWVDSQQAFERRQEVEKAYRFGGAQQAQQAQQRNPEEY